MTVLYAMLLCACGGVYVDVCELCMCVRVFKCSDVMVSYVMSSSILINHY